MWNTRLLDSLLSILVGVLCFFIASYPEILSPSNLNWLRGEDPALHYLGWSFFRHTPWEFPLGFNPNFGLEIATSIIYTDSIPLLAIPFKLINPWLSDNFQFLGIWTFICFIGQSIISWKIIGLKSHNLIIRLIGTAFLTFSPILIENLGWDTALLSHFFILGALYISFLNTQKYERLYWQAILAGSFLVQFYIFAMILPLWIADLARLYFHRKLEGRKIVVEVLLALILLFLCAWIFGYFEANASAAPAWGFGFYRLNLLSPFTPNGWSYLIKDWYQSTSSVESFGYLGLGSLFLIACLAFKAKQGIQVLGNAIQSYKYLAAALMLLLIFSLSSNIGIGAFEIRIPISENAYKIASTLRSSGRLFWPCWYAIMILAIFLTLHLYKGKTALALLGAALLIQLADTSAGWLPIRENKTGKSGSSSIFEDAQIPLRNNFWVSAGNKYDAVKLAPLRHDYTQKLENDGTWNWLRFASFANQFKIGTNSVYLVRADSRKIESANSMLYKQISSGIYQSKTLLILDDDLVIPASIKLNSNSDLLARIDGMNVLAPGWKLCNSCAQIDSSLEIKKNFSLPQLGVPIEFSKNSNGTQFLTQVGRSQEIGWGWSYPESWGTWSDGYKSRLVLPTPEDKFNELVIHLTPFLDKATHSELSFEVSVNNLRKILFNLNQPGPQTITLNLREINKDQNFIKMEFSYRNAASPKSIGLGDDDRKLGIGIISATYK